MSVHIFIYCRLSLICQKTIQRQIQSNKFQVDLSKYRIRLFRIQNNAYMLIGLFAAPHRMSNQPDVGAYQ